MSEPLTRLAAYAPFGLPVPGVGPVIHLEHHGACIIAVKWDGERSVPWWRFADPESDWVPHGLALMPLKRSTSKAAFSANIRAERAAGRPIKQAVAIAYSEKRAAAKAAPKHKGLINRAPR